VPRATSEPTFLFYQFIITFHADITLFLWNWKREITFYHNENLPFKHITSFYLNLRIIFLIYLFVSRHEVHSNSLCLSALSWIGINFCRHYQLQMEWLHLLYIFIVTRESIMYAFPRVCTGMGSVTGAFMWPSLLRHCLKYQPKLSIWKQPLLETWWQTLGNNNVSSKKSNHFYPCRVCSAWAG